MCEGIYNISHFISQECKRKHRSFFFNFQITILREKLIINGNNEAKISVRFSKKTKDNLFSSYNLFVTGNHFKPENCRGRQFPLRFDGIRRKLNEFHLLIRRESENKLSLYKFFVQLTIFQ